MMIKCPKCNSTDVLSYLVSITAFATVHLNTWEVIEIDDAVFEEPDSVDRATCDKCDYQWDVESYVGEDGMYAYRPVNDN
jgi:hypothetical protein